MLLAYSDPAESPVKHLLAMQHREDLADSLNSAILSKHTRTVPSDLGGVGQRESALETNLRQLIQVNATGPDGATPEELDMDGFLRDIAA